MLSFNLVNGRLISWQFCLQVAEILKDRPSWYRDCRSVDIINVLATGSNGTIELLYMQVRACSFAAACFNFSMNKNLLNGF